MDENLTYEDLGEAPSPDKMKAALARDDPEELLQLVISIGLYAEDPVWSQSICQRLSRHPHHIVRGNAVLCFGHLARRFGALDRNIVLPLIESALIDEDSYVRGQARGAAEDVRHFLNWQVSIE